MSDTEQPQQLTAGSTEPPQISFAEFLEAVPPSQVRGVGDLVIPKTAPNGHSYFVLATPELLLHCSTDSVCNGKRIFRFADRDAPTVDVNNFKYIYLRYLCSNCRRSQKVFSVAAIATGGKLETGQSYKFGELPEYGPPTSSRLINLIGPDRDLFLRGRRCENQGLGIGAFVYYRRVVEGQKSRILENILKLAEKLSASAEVICAIESAIKETQFSKAVDSVKNAIPQSLLIDGHNPITLLHSALSDGLHTQTDERCLEIAHDIRVVLGELSERLATALKDERELGESVSRLLRKKAREF
jgi:hypothetical protein